MKSIQDIIAIFGKTNDEVAAALEVHPTTVSSWTRTRRIGRENWNRIIKGAAARGAKVDANVLHELCAMPGTTGRKRGRPGHQAASEVTPQSS